MYFREERSQKYMVHLEQTWINQYSMHSVSFDCREPAQLYHCCPAASQLRDDGSFGDPCLQGIHARVTGSGFWTDKLNSAMELYCVRVKLPNILHRASAAWSSGDWGRATLKLQHPAAFPSFWAWYMLWSHPAHTSPNCLLPASHQKKSYLYLPEETSSILQPDPNLDNEEKGAPRQTLE